MRIERSTLLSLSLLSACVQDVNIGLNDAGSNDTGTAADTGAGDSGTVADTGPEITCIIADVECTAACQAGFTPRPDLTCNTGSVCCSTEQTTCTGDAIQCTACGRQYPPRCVGTTWVCDPIDCIPCNVDSECDEGFDFCENDFAARNGMCSQCPPPPPLPCPETARQLQWGNGCGYYSCDDPPGGWLEIDPSTLTFFSLPIGSLRYAISGHDPDARVCATLVWTIGSIDDEAQAQCGESTPYVVLIGDTDGPCGQWDYAGNVASETAFGCYDFAEFAALGSGREPHQDLVDLELMVTSTTHTGGIRMKNRTTTQPWPVSFTLRYTTDTPGESLWIQNRDLSDEQGWVTLYADGVRLPIGTTCDVDECPESGASCPLVQREARNIIRPGDFGGSATLTWDGWVHAMPTGVSCVERQAAHPRDYEVEFCFGRSLDTSTGEELVQNVDCRRMSFTYPTLDNEVELRIDEGG